MLGKFNLNRKDMFGKSALKTNCKSKKNTNKI
jgi:hypothetical protein